MRLGRKKPLLGGGRSPGSTCLSVFLAQNFVRSHPIRSDEFPLKFVYLK